MDEDMIRQVTRLERRLDGLARPEVSLSLISETVLSGSAASVTFSSIPSSFRALRLMIAARSDRSAEVDTVSLRFNGDSGANYDTQAVFGNAASAAGSAARGGTNILAGNTEAANSRANVFAPSDVTIFQYNNSSIEKFLIGLTGSMGDVSADTDMLMTIRLGRWRSAAAITSITLLPTTGPNFVADSVFTLYGIS
jgi:hypothetical protein